MRDADAELERLGAPQRLRGFLGARLGDADIGLAERDLLRARTVAHALIGGLRGLCLTGKRLRVGLERSATILMARYGVDELSRPGDDTLITPIAAVPIDKMPSAGSTTPRPVKAA